MRTRLGLTEEFWGALSEDKRFAWKISTLILAFIVAPLTSRTGHPALDWFVAALAITMTQLVVESQRHLSQYQSVRLRKNLLRFIVGFGTYAVTFLGIMFFLGIGYGFAKALLPAMVESTGLALQKIQGAIFLVIISMMTGHALFQSFRRLQLESALMTIPRTSLRSLLIDRRYIVGSAIEFAAFELSVYLVVFYYFGAATSLVTTIIHGGLV